MIELLTFQLTFIFLATLFFIFFVLTIVLLFKFRKFFRFLDEINKDNRNQYKLFLETIIDHESRSADTLANMDIDMQNIQQDLQEIRIALAFIEAKTGVVHIRNPEEKREKRPTTANQKS